MVKKYRLRNSTIEAIFYDGNNYDEIASFCNGNAYKPYYSEKGVRLFTLNTRFGETKVHPREYIVRLGYRLFISVKENIFLERYEEASEESYI